MENSQQTSIRYEIGHIERMINHKNPDTLPYMETIRFTMYRGLSGMVQETLTSVYQMGFGDNSGMSWGDKCWGWEIRECINDTFTFEPKKGSNGVPYDWKEEYTERKNVKEDRSFLGDEWSEWYSIETVVYSLPARLVISKTGEVFLVKIYRHNTTKTLLKKQLR